MRSIMMAVLLTSVMALPATGTGAREPTNCGAKPASLPPELSGWATRAPLAAAMTASRVKTAELTLGAAVDAALKQTVDVQYLVRPEKPGGTVSYGGMFGFAVAEAGIYRVSLGSGAWIDVLDGKKPVASSAHGHGPDCSGIRKMVDFPLKPGHYVCRWRQTDRRPWP